MAFTVLRLISGIWLGLMFGCILAELPQRYVIAFGLTAVVFAVWELTEVVKDED